MTIPELAERAYIAYYHSRDHGEALPRPWPMLDRWTREAWCAVAEEIVTAIREDALAQMPAGPAFIVTTRENAADVFRMLAEQRGVTPDGTSERDPAG
ncbi:hypothetical protein ACQEVF_59480 [Nonomuraea polychroma]|uniref:hypothetical protein n=1 Tax=Nonomuraea polychroma TaxID=46176 RepID=UPI003D8ACAA6